MVKVATLLIGLFLSFFSWGMVKDQTLQDGEVVTLLCEEEEIKIDLRLAKLANVIKDFRDDWGSREIFLLPESISLSTWKVIQDLLGRVYSESNQGGSGYPQQNVLEILQSLEVPVLIKVLAAIDCLDIPCLLPNVLHVASEIDVCALSVEELEIVPIEARGLLVMYHATNLLGPLPGTVVATHEEKQGEAFLKASCKTVYLRKKPVVISIGVIGELEKDEDDSLQRHQTPYIEGITCCCALRGCKNAAGYNDGTVRVWDTTTGKQLLVCTSSNGVGIQSISMLDAGSLIAVYTDETMRIWDIHRGKELAVCRGVGIDPKFSIDLDGNFVSCGLYSSQSLVSSLFGGHFAGSRRVVHVWDISLLNRLSMADEHHMHAIWLVLQQIAQQKKLGTFTGQEGWNTLAHILEEADPGIISRAYWYVRNRLDGFLERL